MFSIVPISFRPSPQQNTVTSVAVGSGVLILAVSGICHIIRVSNDSPDVLSTTLSKSANDVIYKVFIHPNGHHTLVSLTNGSVYYLSSKWSNKAHMLTKVKSVLIDSVGWNTHQGNDKVTGKFLIGTSKGQIFETQIEEKDKYFKVIYFYILNFMCLSLVSLLPCFSVCGSRSITILVMTFIIYQHYLTISTLISCRNCTI